MRGLFRLVIAVSGLVLLLIMARGLGRLAAQDVHAALDVKGCVQPCWRGIRPGETPFELAERALRADRTLQNIATTPDSVCWDMQEGPFVRGCAYTWKNLGSGRDQVEIINLFPRGSTFRLGDAVAYFGPPLAAVMSCQNINGNVYFRDSIIAVLPIDQVGFGPESRVTYLSYVSSRLPWYGPNTPPWRGFRVGWYGTRC